MVVWTEAEEARVRRWAELLRTERAGLVLRMIRRYAVNAEIKERWIAGLYNKPKQGDTVSCLEMLYDLEGTNGER